MASTADVTSLYKELLGRDPDSGGLNFYSGWSDVNKIRNDILGSAEYKARSSATAQPAATAAPAADPYWSNQVSGLYGELGNTQVQNPVDVYNASLDKLGISDARTRVTTLREALLNSENLLKALPGDVQARTQDFNVSENQRNRITAMESQPISGQIDTLNGALGVASQDYGMILNEGKATTEYQYNYEKDQRQAVMDRLQVAIERSDSDEDKRRWEAELARQKDLDAEATRQFNAQLALDQQNAKTAAAKSSSSSSSSSASKTAAKTAAAKQVVDYISTSGRKGSDGYIGPNTYKELKADWVSAGYSASEFDANFRMYANPSQLSTYGLK